jgi:hypothetical protein
MLEGGVLYAALRFNLDPRSLHCLDHPGSGYFRNMEEEKWRHAAMTSEYTRDRNRQYEQHIASLIQSCGYEPRYATDQEGASMVWVANLLHGGAALRDRNRTRQSQVSHYLFEGATGYYTAMISESDRRVWTEPEWLNP